jgi:hypothetical protein
LHLDFENSKEGEGQAIIGITSAPFAQPVAQGEDTPIHGFVVAGAFVSGYDGRAQRGQKGTAVVAVEGVDQVSLE